MNPEADKISSNSSEVSLLSIEFKVNLNRKLDEKIASLEAEVAEITASNAAWKENMKSRCARMKDTKKERNVCKKRIHELEKTRENYRESGKELTEYAQILKADLKNYEGETLGLAKEHKESIKDMEDKWTIYQAQYETLEFAVLRSKEWISLQTQKIQLMVKQYKLAEIKKIIAMQGEIDIKRRNSLVVECAKFYKASQSEDMKMRNALATQSSLRQELLRQETMIENLIRKQKEQQAIAQQSVTRKPHTMIVPLFALSQIRPLKMARLELSSIAGTVTQPMPTFRKDYHDTISITSSIIDNLIESGSLLESDTNNYCCQDSDQTVGAADLPVNNQEKLNPTTIEPGNISKDLDNKKEGAQERIEENSLVDESIDMRDILEYDSLGVTKEVEVKEQRSGDDFRKKPRAEQEYLRVGDAPQKKPACRSFLAESSQELRSKSPMNRPKIMNIEKVQLNLPPQPPITPKRSQEDFLARYFAASAASSVNFNWKPDHPTSLLNYSDSQRGNTGLESVVESEVSMQPEDIIEKFYGSLSSDQEDRREPVTLVADDRKRHETLHATRKNASPTGEPQQIAAPFLDMGTFTDSSNRGNKKDSFFFNMF